DVPVSYKRVPVPNDYPTGVTLHILDTHDIWSSDDIEELKKDLTGLISPFPTTASISGMTRDLGFRVIIDVDGNEQIPTEESDLSEEFLNSGWGVLEGNTDENGNATYHMQFLRTDNSPETLEDTSEIYNFFPNINFKIYFHM